MRKIIKKLFVISILAIFFFQDSSFAKNVDEEILNKGKLEYVNLPFFEKFGDEFLIEYIIKALQNNHSARASFFESQKFRYEVSKTFAIEFPTLNVQANYLGLKVPLLDNFAFKKNGFLLPFELNWEADLLLKNRDKVKSKRSLYRAQKYDEYGTYLMLAADVASVYINILKFDKTISLYEKLLSNQKEILEKNRLKYNNGLISRLDLNDETNKLTNRTIELQNLKKQRKFLLNQLASFVGESAFISEDLPRGKFEDFGKNVSIPKTLSSDLIYNRPDILSAQSKLKSAKIDITVAKKEFFPTFNVQGLYLFNTLSAGNFFSWRSTFATLLAGVSQDIFTGGRKIANLKLEKAKYEKALEEFLQKDIEALKELNDALYQAKYDKKILDDIYDIYLVEKDNFSLDKLRYKNGVIGFLDFLEAKDELNLIEQNLVEKRAVKFVDLISIYKAAGGRP